MIFNTMAVQIQGTRALCPWSPKKRYMALALCSVGA
jgi:hypothetical protein